MKTLTYSESRAHYAETLNAVIDDREGDIYEKWARLPDARTQLLSRASQDRNLADGGN